MTWEEAKINSDKLELEIENNLQKFKPTTIAEVLKIINAIDNKTSCIPNCNDGGQYCQLILYPSSKWKTWNKMSMSISKYNIYN